MGGRRRGRLDDPGLRDVDERQQGRRRSRSRSSRRPRTTTSTSSGSATTNGDGARLIAVEPGADRARRPSRRARPSPTTGLIDCGNWAVVAVVDRPEHRGLGRLHRPPRAQRHRRRQPDRRSSCATTRATRTSCCRPPTRPGRPTTPTAATASTSAPWPARPASPRAYKAAYKVSYNRPVPHGRGRRRPLVALHRRRVPDDPLPRAQRLRRELHLERGRRHATAAAAAEPQGLHLQRARRVLVGLAARRTSRPRATPASTSPSSPATRCSGRRAGSRAPTAPTRQDRTLVSYKDTHFTERAGPRRVDRHLARPALHDAVGERHAGERADRPDRSWSTRARRAITVPFAYKNLRLWRNTAAASLTVRAEPARSRPTRSATSGTQDADNGFRPTGAVQALLDDRRAASRSSPTTAARPRSTGPPRTT